MIASSRPEFPALRVLHPHEQTAPQYRVEKS
jgi:hypothetical protein